MEKNKKRFILILLISSIAIVLLVAGATYTIFNYIASGFTENTINAGNIVFHYDEKTNKGHGISITNAFPVNSNIEAMTSNENIFDFKITSKTSLVNIPYTVTARMTDDSSMVMGNIVNLYLTEVDKNGNETPLSDGMHRFNNMLQVSNFSEDQYIEKVLYNGMVYKNNNNYEKNFRLRMWVDENVEITNGDSSTNYNNKTFAITVNIYATGANATPTYTAELEGNNVTFSSNTVDVQHGSTVQVTITPASGYYVSGYSCTNDYTITGLTTGASATTAQTITINNNNQTTGSTCTFTTAQAMGEFKSMLLADNTVKTTAPTFTSSTSSNGESGLYKKSVTNGFGGTTETADTYYFRGAVTNNVVEFSGHTWRIVRINEDETIRLILDYAINDNGVYLFNENYTNYSYMYYSNSGEYLKKTVDDWYAANITGDNATKVASGNYFCEAARVKYNSGQLSGNATMTVYSSYIPTLDCTKDGNGKQYVPGAVGLITYDEAVMAGSYFNEISTNYYIYKTANNVNNAYYWMTMSPAGFDGTSALVWLIGNSGHLIQGYVKNQFEIRPVINLKADVSVTKDESTGHYVVQ